MFTIIADPPKPEEKEYTAAIPVPYGNFNNMIEWCNNECYDSWRVNMSYSNDEMAFIFSDETDCSNFIMMWFP